jgi:tripartite-type tricarboxylate transporter receptor subunit TctC
MGERVNKFRNGVSAFLVILFGAAGSAGAQTPAAGAAQAAVQSYPAKIVRVIVPQGVGDTGDILARLISVKVGERLGRQFVVDNRPGAAGQLGLEVAARAVPDGYTISMGQGTNLAIVPHTYKAPRYDPLKDFAPIAVVATSYSALVVHPGTPFKTMKELIAYGRANPEKLTAASGSELGFQHLSFELLRLQSGARFTHIAYKGSAAIVSDLISGQVDLSMSSYTAFAPHIRSGRMRMLAITNPTRVALLPNTPALAETVPGYDMRGWYGFVAPAAVPREIITLLNAEINRATAQPDVREKLALAGLDIPSEPPEFFVELIRRESAKFGKLVRDAGLKPQ